LEELAQLKKAGWYTESENPSPIPPGDIPTTNADDSNKPNPTPLTESPNAGAREEEKVDDPAKDNEPILLVTDLNVADARTVVESTFELDVLKAIEKEEKANKDRVGVHSAIEAQRELIKNTDPNK